MSNIIKFKIVSNPYKEDIKFGTIDENSNQMIEVSKDENSDLNSDEIRKGFFPYNVKKIINEIIAMKSKQGNVIQIEFEGTDDEFSELEELCQEKEYQNRIELLPQTRYLNNAKDILPKIAEIFQEMQPLIADSINSNPEIALMRKKFDEAVDNKKIPICVIGNYSSGKSTFINALIGKEILPSGDDPITDCVYQLNRSHSSESGYVEFDYFNLPLKISIEKHNSRGKGCVISGPGKRDDEFMCEIQDEMDKLTTSSIHVRIHFLLVLIEKHKKKLKRNNIEKDISSLIKINLPFSKEGVLSQSQYNYVIFDTPGEGSATNIDHSKILEQQMQLLSNGLIMFITDNKSLDKVEGRDLCEKIISMNCFDKRFTMVIANRADSARLPKDGYFEPEEIEDKLSQTVCRTLQSNRIFYVSSIVGLGSKQEDDFIDEDYQDVYDKEIESYLNPNSKHPKALYKSNIIPVQIKNKCVKWSEEEPNKAFANSGLFWIEQEIRLFAEVHSPYNKCTLSKKFLDEIISETTNRIIKNVKQCEVTKKELNEKLINDKNEFVISLDKKVKEVGDEIATNYPTKEMKDITVKAYNSITREYLDERQTAIEKEIGGKHNYNELKNAPVLTQKDAADEPPENSKSFTAYKQKKEYKKNLHDLEKQIEKEVSESLLKEIKEQFTQDIHGNQTKLEMASQTYWLQASESFKNTMIDYVTKSEGISDEKKIELEKIIADYKTLTFEKNADMVFVFSELTKHWLKIGSFVIGASNSLNLNKLKTRYNSSMRDNTSEMLNKLKTSHEGSFKTWKSNLINDLKDNIIKLNPDLRDLNNSIIQQEENIAKSENTKNRLNDYKVQIENLMNWIQ